MRSLSLRLSALLCALSFLTAAHAMGGKPPAEKSAASAVSYTWHDGERERTAYLNPALVAEFGLQSPEQSAVKRAHPGAALEPGKFGAVRLWRLDATASAERALRDARALDPAGKYSPVFQDSAAGEARKRALPGNVIVTFKPEWSEAQVHAWVAAQGLAIARKLEIGPNVYVLKTEPGLVALETANRIRAGGEVVAAMPDWWQEFSKR
jgi:hypothetical protein